MKKKTKKDEDDFCLGYCSVLSLPYYITDTKNQDNIKAMEKMADFITSTYLQSVENKTAFKHIRKSNYYTRDNLSLDDLSSYFSLPKSERHVGLMLSGRYVNLPVQCVPCLYNSVLEDIKWTQGSEYITNEEERKIRMPANSFSFTHFIGFSKATRNQNINPKHIETIFDLVDQETIDRPEHDEFLQKADLIWTFNLDLKNNNNKDEEGLKVQDTGIIYIISKKTMTDIITSLL